MAEYIEREAVLKIIADNCPHDKCGYNTEEEMGAGVACYYIRKDVDNIPTADVVPKSEVEKLEKESSVFAEIIHKQDDEIQQLRKSLLTKQALEEEFSKSVKKIEKQALKTIENAKQEVAREIFEEIDGITDLFAKAFINELEMYDQLAELKKKYTESEGKE